MAVDLTDYSRTAAQRGWGAGWPSCGGANAAGTAVVTADRSGTRVSVHKRVARLVDLLMDTTEARGYLLKPGQCGAYNCRAIAGTSSPSNHSWALAVDINWRDNAYGARTWSFPDWAVALWNRYGFAWGGHYRGTKDPMHVEFMGTPGDADALTSLAIRELTGSVPPPVVTGLAPGARGDRVKDLQRVLNAWYRWLHLVEDGIYGPATAAGVREYQRRAGLGEDGVAGPLVLAKLGLA